MNLDRMRMAWLLLAASACSTAAPTGSGSQNLDEAAEAAIARFEPYLNDLRSSIESAATPEDAAHALLSSGRTAAFDLQALGRLYKDRNPKFAGIRDDFKSLEDGIGQYSKWQDIYEASVQRNIPNDSARANRDSALTSLTRLLTANNWRSSDPAVPTRIAMYTDFLNTYDWNDRATDRGVVIDSLMSEVAHVQNTAYDMGILEDGNGVHQLKKDVRWIGIELTTLNGMVVTKGDACPIAAYANAGNRRFSSMRASALEPNPCQISACLVSALGEVVDGINVLKDKVEIDNNIGGVRDDVPPATRAAAQAIYDKMTSSNLMAELNSEFKACKSAL